MQRLTISQIKQIGGRAGRYRTASQVGDNNSRNTPRKRANSEDNENVGFVTCLEDVDLPYIQDALKNEAPPILAAGLLAPDYIIRNFAEHFPPKTPFPYILQRMHNISQTSPHFFLCEIKEQCSTTDTIDTIQGLSVADKLIFMAAPAPTRDPALAAIVRGFARCVAENKSGGLLDIPELPLEVLNKPVSSDKEYLRSLEALHRALVLYLWLSYRCGGIFTDRTLATHTKELVEINMDRALTEFSANKKLRKASSLRRQIALLRQMEDRERAYEQADDSLENPLEDGEKKRWEDIAHGVLDKASRSSEAPSPIG